MKIYTRQGDQGQTSLLDGSRVSKSHIRVEAYGTIDELNAHVAHLKDVLNIDDMDESVIECLHRVSRDLFDIGSLLAVDNEDYHGKLAKFDPEAILILEKEIDRMDEALEPLRDFILPGGHPLISQCHICRTVCRRAERRVVTLAEKAFVEDDHLVFLNRLSDYLFTLARYIAFEYGVEEDKWH